MNVPVIISVLTDECPGGDEGSIIERLATVEGITHVDFRKVGGKQVYELSDDEVLDLKDALARNGTSVASISGDLLKIPWWGFEDDRDEMPDGTPVPDHQLGLVRRCVEIARVLGAPAIRMFGFHHVSFFPGEHDIMWADFIDHLGKARDIVAAAGKTLVIENVRDSLVSGAASITRVLGEVHDPAVKIILDPSNLVASAPGEAFSEQFFQHVKDRTAAIHVRDVAITSHDPYTTRWVLVGDGVVDWPGIARAYLDDGYDGLFTIEHHLGPVDAWTSVHETITRFKDIINGIK